LLNRISDYLSFLKFLQIKRSNRPIEKTAELQQNKKEEKKDNQSL
jgi:hypothetical protein